MCELTVWLRPTTQADLGDTLAVERAQENRRFILPWTREQHYTALADLDSFHAIVNDLLGRAVGFLIESGLTSGHRCIRFRRLVITDKGRGYGRAASRPDRVHP